MPIPSIFSDSDSDDFETSRVAPQTCIKRLSKRSTQASGAAGLPLRSRSQVSSSTVTPSPLDTVFETHVPKVTSGTRGARARIERDGEREECEQREQCRPERQAIVQAKRQQRIRDAFESHANSTIGRRDAIEIVVSPSMFYDHTRRDVLKSVRISFPHQIVSEPGNNTNLIKWRRIVRTPSQQRSQSTSKSFSPPYSQIERGSQSQVSDEHTLKTAAQMGAPLRHVTVGSSYEDVSIRVFVFSAQQYIMHVDKNTLDECARSVKVSLHTHRIIFAVWGMDLEIRRRMRTAAKERTDAFILDKRAIQDSYAYLYIEHGIHSHESHDLDELGNYIRDLTNAIATAPCTQEDDLVSASLVMRRNRAKAGYRTAVISHPGTIKECPGYSESPEGNEEDAGYCASQKGASMVRVEGEQDAGHTYLTMLCLIPGVTLVKAQCIREHFPTLRTLLDAYDECSSDEQRVLLLSDLRHGANNRRLGPTLSKSIATVLTSLHGNTPV